MKVLFKHFVLACSAMALASCAEGLEDPELYEESTSELHSSQSMDLIISDAHAALCGFDYSNASATITRIPLWGGRELVRLRVNDGPPNRLFTAWVKLDGTSPLTGAGATPLARTSLIDDLAEASPPDAGDPAPRANGWYTNHNGDGTKNVVLDWRFSGGVYPFSAYDANLADVDLGSTPFSVRLITHCFDELGHGLTPGTHEPTFQTSF